MSGVSALMSMGLFSLRGNNSLTPRYELTSPVFDEIKIELNQTYYKGKKFNKNYRHKNNKFSRNRSNQTNKKNRMCNN